MKKYLLLLSILSLVACSDDDPKVAPIPGSGLPPMSGEQKSAMSSASLRISEYLNATNLYNKENDNNIVTGPLKSDNGLSQKAQQLKSKIKGYVSAQVCKSQKNENQSNNGNLINANISEKYMDLNDCPFDSQNMLSISGTVQQTDSSAVANATLTGQTSFSIKQSSEIYQLADIYDYTKNLNATINVNAGPGSLTMIVNGTENMTFKVKTDGDINVSTKISVIVAGSENDMGVNSNITLEYELNGFKVIGYIQLAFRTNPNNTMQTDIKPTLYINGQVVDEAEFTKYFHADELLTSWNALDAFDN